MSLMYVTLNNINTNLYNDLYNCLGHDLYQKLFKLALSMDAQLYTYRQLLHNTAECSVSKTMPFKPPSSVA